LKPYTGPSPARASARDAHEVHAVLHVAVHRDDRDAATAREAPPDDVKKRKHRLREQRPAELAQRLADDAPHRAPLDVRAHQHVRRRDVHEDAHGDRKRGGGDRQSQEPGVQHLAAL
jgi:hypothetical protein